MRLFIKIYADDLKSASQTTPLVIRGTNHDLTIGQLKNEIEFQIKPPIPIKYQILAIKRGTGVIVSEIRYLQIYIKKPIVHRSIVKTNL